MSRRPGNPERETLRRTFEGEHENWNIRLYQRLIQYRRDLREFVVSEERKAIVWEATHEIPENVDFIIESLDLDFRAAYGDYLFRMGICECLLRENYSKAIFNFEIAFAAGHATALMLRRWMHTEELGNDRQTAETLLNMDAMWSRLLNNRNISIESQGLFTQYPELLIARLRRVPPERLREMINAPSHLILSLLEQSNRQDLLQEVSSLAEPAVQHSLDAQLIRDERGAQPHIQGARLRLLTSGSSGDLPSRLRDSEGKEAEEKRPGPRQPQPHQ